MALLDEAQQLALAVSWLRNQGSAADGRWSAYIKTLGTQNPAGWAKTPQQLAADHSLFLHSLGLDLSWWQYFVAQVQEQMAAEAVALCARFGKALGVTAADVLWGLGQVQARKVVIDNKELWADSDDGQLFSSAVVEQGHLAPLTWYLQHGQLPAAVTAVNMR
eukprot:gene7786-7984_t